MKSYNNHSHSYHSKNQQKNNAYRKDKPYQSRNKDNFSEYERYQNKHSKERHGLLRSILYNTHQQRFQSGSHISFEKQFLRALFGILSAWGFGAFWYALSQGVKGRMLIFVVGTFWVLNVFLHLFFVIKKQVKNKRT